MDKKTDRACVCSECRSVVCLEQHRLDTQLFDYNKKECIVPLASDEGVDYLTKALAFLSDYDLSGEIYVGVPPTDTVKNIAQW